MYLGQQSVYCLVPALWCEGVKEAKKFVVLLERKGKKKYEAVLEPKTVFVAVYGQYGRPYVMRT